VTHDSFAVSESVLQDFTRRRASRWRSSPVGDAGVLVNQAILTKGDPLGDVLFGVDNTLLSRASTPTSSSPTSHRSSPTSAPSTCSTTSTA
jgi:thiamine transport system substrate-binding protein